MAHIPSLSTNSSTVYLNLPVCLIALGVLLFALHGVDVGAAQETSWRGFTKTFDFLGL